MIAQYSVNRDIEAGEQFPNILVFPLFAVVEKISAQNDQIGLRFLPSNFFHSRLKMPVWIDPFDFLSGTAGKMKI